MKVNVEIISRPSITSFTLFAQPTKEQIVNGEKIFVDAYQESKTLVSTGFQIGQSSQKASWKIDGFNFREKVKTNMFSMEQVVVNYFVLSKKQGLPQYIEYIKKLTPKYLQRYGVTEEDLPEVTVYLFKPKFDD